MASGSDDMTRRVRARLRLDPAFTVGPVDRRIFGSFVEHLGRCVYTGIYEPDHPTADEYGFRGDVAALVRELGPTIVRYPGGNFVSAYRWEDGVGPLDHRPSRIDLAWGVVESNAVGTDEFLAWCERLELEPMMAVNLGTRGLVEAVDLLEYTNREAGTELADRRVGNGRRDPYDVRVWCLGNEMDGDWQLGRKTPAEYARLAEETARAMRRVDGRLELVACGSSNRGMETFGTWERMVLERCFDLVEHVSAHAYYRPVDDDQDSFLASAADMDRFIDGVVATADHVAAVRRSTKRIMISFDEWNVWIPDRFGRIDPEPAQNVVAEDVYDATDAVVVGSLLIELLRHADRVAIACQAQLVNLLAPILTRPGGAAWRQTIFHPFALTAAAGTGTVLATALDTPTFDTPAYGEVGQVHATAVYDDPVGTLTLLAVNRGRAEPVDLAVDLTGFDGTWRVVDHLQVHEDDPHASNTENEPDRVVPRTGRSQLADAVLSVDLPPVSWHRVRLARA